MAAKVVSIINLKGGVGKSTLAMILAEYLAFHHSKRVLLIDLDSQFNLTSMMLKEDDVVLVNQQGKTMYHLFRAVLNGQTLPIDNFIISTPQVTMSNIARWQRDIVLDMVVSSPSLAQLLDEEMLDEWERILSAWEEQGQPPPKGLRSNIRDLRLALKKTLAPALSAYNVVIIDCAPGLSLFTTNAIIASDYWVCPVIPETLSMMGVRLVNERIEGLKRRFPQEVTIEHAGSILNKVMHYRNPHKLGSQLLYNDWAKYRCFLSWIPDSGLFRKVGEFQVEDLPYSGFTTVANKYEPGYTLTNPVGFAVLDRSNDEGQSYRLPARLMRLSEEFIKRINL